MPIVELTKILLRVGGILGVADHLGNLAGMIWWVISPPDRLNINQAGIVLLTSVAPAIIFALIGVFAGPIARVITKSGTTLSVGAFAAWEQLILLMLGFYFLVYSFVELCRYIAKVYYRARDLNLSVFTHMLPEDIGWMTETAIEFVIACALIFYSADLVVMRRRFMAKRTSN